MYNVTVVIGTNLDKDILHDIPANTTLRQVCESVGFDYASGQLTLDGGALNPGELDKTFAQLGIASKCYLLRVAKTQNA